LPHPFSLLGRTFSSFLFSDFVEEKMYKIIRKTWHFYYFEIRIAIQGESLCCFQAYVYYDPNWFISTRPLHYFLFPFPK
jgi:hypothetical protein